MKLKLNQLPDTIKDAVMDGVQDYIDMIDECDFDLDGEVGLIYRYNVADGDFKYKDADIYWKAEITFEIRTSYSVGDYLTPSSYDVEDITATDIDLLYVSIDDEKEDVFVEFEN
jgi:hypothetical protein